MPLTSAHGFRWGEGAALLELGDTIRHEGEYEAALVLCQQGLSIFQQINGSLNVAYSLLTCALIHGYLGDYGAVAALITQVPRLLEQSSAQDAQRYGWLIQATLAWLQGDYAQGVTHANAGLQTLAGQNNLLYCAHFLVVLGHNQAGCQQASAAQSAYAEALTHYTKLDLAVLAVEPRAGLAQLALEAGDLTTAQNHVEAILATLQEYPHAGYDEPFFAYLTCYRVLAATHDERANAILALGQRLLQHYAAQIHDEARRRAFLDNVPVHRALQAAYAKLQQSL